MENKIIKTIGNFCPQVKKFMQSDTQECVEKIMAEPSDNLDMDLYSTKSYQIQIPSPNSIDTQQNSTDYQWIDYCPETLREIRQLEGVDPDEYMLAVRNPETITELNLIKRGGNVPFGFNDRKYLIRVMGKLQHKQIIELMPSYYQHLKNNNHTLLSKIYGIHVFQPIGRKKVRFVVFGNQMFGQRKIHKQFYFRTNVQGELLDRSGAIDDISIGFQIQPSMRQELLEQVKRDCEFLEATRVQDYTFTLGMHVCPTPFDAIAKSRHRDQNDSGNDDFTQPVTESDVDCNSRNSYADTTDNPYKTPFLNLPARAVDKKRLDNDKKLQVNTTMDQKNNVILYLGMIDTTEDQSVRKRVENNFRTRLDNSAGSTKSKTYAIKFQEMMANIFPEDVSSLNNNDSQ